MTKVISALRRAWRPLASRKVRVALATVIGAFAAEFGLEVSDDLVFTILGVGAALILGIAHEDAGRLSRSDEPAQGERDGSMIQAFHRDDPGGV